MDKIITKDNSITYHNEKYDETYHSITGAKEESVKKFIEPCIPLIKSKDTIKVLDICFGLGYNSAALIDYIIKNHPDKKVLITALEIDTNIISKIPYNDESRFDNYNIMQELARNNIKENVYKLSKNNLTIKIIIGDATQSIKKTQNKFDIIFLDPFSPKKCPELWSEEFIKNIKEHMEEKAILTTYSCARIVKDNLKNNDLVITDGPCVGRRSPSTIARNI